MAKRSPEGDVLYELHFFSCVDGFLEFEIRLLKDNECGVIEITVVCSLGYDKQQFSLLSLYIIKKLLLIFQPLNHDSMHALAFKKPTTKVRPLRETVTAAILNTP